MYSIFFNQKIEAHFQNAENEAKVYDDLPFPISWIIIAGGVIKLDKNYKILNPEAITLQGDMSEIGLANRLPLNYIPDEKVLTKGKMVVTNPERLLEKIYLHTDRNYYYTGEKLLFKAYMYYNELAIKDSLSKVMYVDLIGSDYSIVTTKKFKIENGFSMGEIIFADTLMADNYQLRAYTSWMRNYGDKAFFVKNVPLLEVSERIKNDDQFVLSEKQGAEKLTLSINKANFGKREKLTLQINLRDSLNQPLASNLSVSITSTEFASPTFTQNSIKDWHTNTFASMKVDREVFIHPVEKALSFKGVFFNEREKPAYTKFQAFFNGYSTVLDLETDDKGYFEIKDMFFDGTQTAIFQAKNRKDNTYGKFKLYDLDRPVVGTIRFGERQGIVDVGIPIYIQDILAGATLLEEMTVEVEREVKERPMLYGKPNYSVPAEKLTLGASPTELLMSLKAQTPGMNIILNGAGIERVTLRGGAASAQLSMEPAVMINGQLMSGSVASVFGFINPFDIERIEVVSGINSILGEFGRGGVISIILKDQNSRNIGLVDTQASSATNVILEGFSYYNPISIPDYENDDEEKRPKYDQRPTLYWNPMVTTDSESGIVSIPFYNNDVLAPIFVNVEGITASGTPVRATYLIKP